MIIPSGPATAASFTDDTSADTRNTKKRHVSIHAKVRRETPLEWYYNLLSLCKQEKGELKSNKVLIAYRNMPPERRVKLWDTLKAVQVNITDALPYQEETNKQLKQALKREDAVDYIRHRASANDPAAKKMLELLNNSTAERILLDAPSRMLAFHSYYARNRGGYGLARAIHIDGFGPPPPDHRIPLSRFKSSHQSIVRTVTEWTSKSASVFSDAMDSISYAGVYESHPLLDPVFRALRKSHAFDRGNKKLVDLTDDERTEVARSMRYHEFWLKEYPFSPLQEDVDSRKSFYIQASDIAGGIAKQLYENGGIFTVTQNFEYVIFNGRRISQNEAYETTKKWQELGYYN